MPIQQLTPVAKGAVKIISPRKIFPYAEFVRQAMFFWFICGFVFIIVLFVQQFFFNNLESIDALTRVFEDPASYLGFVVGFLSTLLALLLGLFKKISAFKAHLFNPFLIALCYLPWWFILYKTSLVSRLFLFLELDPLVYFPATIIALLLVWIFLALRFIRILAEKIGIF